MVSAFSSLRAPRQVASVPCRAAAPLFCAARATCSSPPAVLLVPSWKAAGVLSLAELQAKFGPSARFGFYLISEFFQFQKSLQISKIV
jgi:hypothetical protein